MSLLTDDEIDEALGCSTFGGTLDARAVEAAILAKLASAELPEPAYRKLNDPVGYYTADQLRQAYAQGASSQLSAEPFAEIGYAAQTVGSEVKTPAVKILKAIPPVETKLFTLKEPK
jgi:hypothetical protein